MVNSLAQLLIKCTAPGVPDFYQGTELWDLSFVDPDNRRPVDYGMRASLLPQVTGEPSSAAHARALVDTRRDGRIKLFTIARALAVRQALPTRSAAASACRFAPRGRMPAGIRLRENGAFRHRGDLRAAADRSLPRCGVAAAGARLLERYRGGAALFARASTLVRIHRAGTDSDTQPRQRHPPRRG